MLSAKLCTSIQITNSTKISILKYNITENTIFAAEDMKKIETTK